MSFDTLTLSQDRYRSAPHIKMYWITITCHSEDPCLTGAVGADRLSLLKSVTSSALSELRLRSLVLAVRVLVRLAPASTTSSSGCGRGCETHSVISSRRLDVAHA